jgi:hypothetical protein
LHHDVVLLEKTQWCFVVYEVLQVRPVQVLHDEELLTFVLAEFVYCDYVFMMETSSGHGLCAEASAQAWITFGRNDLDGYLATDAWVVSSVNAAKTPASDLSLYFVFAEPPDHV